MRHLCHNRRANIHLQHQQWSRGPSKFFLIRTRKQSTINLVEIPTTGFPAAPPLAPPPSATLRAPLALLQVDKVRCGKRKYRPRRCSDSFSGGGWAVDSEDLLVCNRTQIRPPQNNISMRPIPNPPPTLQHTPSIAISPTSPSTVPPFLNIVDRSNPN